jgi:F-type H+-transporting ATPase subunit d
MKLPSYEGDDVAKAQARFAELNTQADALAAASAARAVEIQAELASIEQEKARISTVTVDEELAADPVMAAEIDAEVAKNDFLVTP